MSDLHDIITSSSIQAFNSGFREGRMQERKEILQLLENTSEGFEMLNSKYIAHVLLDLIKMIEKS